MTIELSDDCTARYWLIVLSPGDLDCLKESASGFKDWLEGICWDGLTCEEFWALLCGNYGNACDIQVAIASGKLDPYDLSLYIPIERTWVYPDFDEQVLLWHEWVWEKNDPSTNELGEYDVYLVGICGSCCNIKCMKFHTSFFVVPEYPIGTIAPLVLGLVSLGIYSKKNRILVKLS
jgi:hypothetical protein